MTKRSHSDYLGDHYEQANKMKRPSFQRQHSLVSRFESLRRQYSEDYYDPYQKEQVQQQVMTSQKVDEDEENKRPTKRRKSITTIIKNGVIQGVLFGSVMALSAIDYLHSTTSPFIKRPFVSIENISSTATATAANINDSPSKNKNDDFIQHGHYHHEKQITKNGFTAFYKKLITDYCNYHDKNGNKNMRGHGVDFTYFHRSPTFGKRIEKTEEMIRSICLDQQNALHQHFSFSTLLKKDDYCWGIIDKDNYGVDFTTMAPPKPKHSFDHLQKQKSVYF
ncbi:unnamed protein product [Cunninghamella blakesleeana]